MLLVLIDVQDVVNMNKKQTKVLIVIVSILAVIAAGAATAYFITASKNAPVTDTNNTQVTAETPDLGACQLVSPAQIREASLGDRIISIQEGVRSGVNSLSGDDAEGCTFAFSTQKANNNVLTVSVYPYTSTQEGFNKEIESARWSEVMGSTPKAYFGRATIDDGATTLYIYRIPTGGSTVLLTLRQTTNTITFDEPDSIDFLGTMGAKLNLTIVQEKSSAQADSTLEGDGPGTPPAGAQEDVLDINDTTRPEVTPTN